LSEPTLKRDIGYTLLTLYGLGTILGAGIYVLIGEVARSAGTAAPAAFLISALMAGVTAFSYAELAARLPRSAGEAAYVAEGFRWSAAATAVGWAVIVTGVVSAATMTRGFVGYLELFVSLPPALVICALVGAVACLAAWGISQSLWLAGAVTVVEVIGLLIVCVVAGGSLSEFPDRWPDLLPDANIASWFGILSGAFVAFYAFIGFEDMVNVAEEVQEPRTTLPRAIVTALIVSTVLYVFIAVIAVLSTPIDALISSDAPLALIVESRGVSPQLIGVISLFAVINGALVQLIMASRVLYGLADQGLASPIFARINARTRTPLLATAVVAACILVFALGFSLDRLARFTSFIALIVFSMVNASLVKLKRDQPDRPEFSVPVGVPVLGFLLCAGMICYQSVAWLSAATQ
jgi:APA family basic amino acid/polyamine antiporter